MFLDSSCTPTVGRELLDSMVELGLLSSHWEVRKAVVEALMVLTFGRHAVLAVARAKESEKRKEVLEVMATFFEKHDLEEALNDDFQRHFQFMYDDWLSDLEDSDKIEDMESDEEWQMRDKHGGYLKSHVSRSGRHHKQHGANSSKAPPAAIARQKKWDRRARQEEQPKFSESKRNLQKFRRDKEQVGPELQSPILQLFHIYISIMLVHSHNASNKCLTSSNKDAIRNRCLTSSNNKKGTCY